MLEKTALLVQAADGTRRPDAPQEAGGSARTSPGAAPTVVVDPRVMDETTKDLLKSLMESSKLDALAGDECLQQAAADASQGRSMLEEEAALIQVIVYLVL